MLRLVLKWILIAYHLTSADGLVGYDTALTRRGSRVQFPVCVMVFLILFNNGYNKMIKLGFNFSEKSMHLRFNLCFWVDWCRVRNLFTFCCWSSYNYELLSSGCSMPTIPFRQCYLMTLFLDYTWSASFLNKEYCICNCLWSSIILRYSWEVKGFVCSYC